MRQMLDRKGWLLAIALPMLTASIYVNWFGPTWLVAWWRGVLYVMAAAAIAGALLSWYLRRRERLQRRHDDANAR